MEKQNFWQTQLFESSEILLRSRAESFSMLEIFGCVAWEPRSFSVFVRYTLHVTQLWASGAMNFSTASQNISPPIWKRKWFMWQSIRVLGKAMIAEQGSECLDRVWKICKSCGKRFLRIICGRHPLTASTNKQSQPTTKPFPNIEIWIHSHVWGENDLFFWKKTIARLFVSSFPVISALFLALRSAINLVAFCENVTETLFARISLLSPATMHLLKTMWNDKIYANQNSWTLNNISNFRE